MRLKSEHNTTTPHGTHFISVVCWEEKGGKGRNEIDREIREGLGLGLGF